MVEISDRKSLEAWLQGQPQQIAVAIGARAALRATPFLSELFEKHPDKNRRDNIILPALRCTIASAVGAVYPTAEAKRAAASAIFAASTIASAAIAAAAAAAASTAAANAANNANAIATNTGSAAAAAAVDRQKFWESVTLDASVVEDGTDAVGLLARPLWSGPGMPVDTETALKVLRGGFASDPAWDFWLRWYDGFLAGRPVKWEIQRDVALIPDDDWKQRPAHIAALIAEIEAKYQPAIDAAKLNRQVSVLLDNAERSEITSAGLARQIEDSISQYMRDAGTNALPEELGILQKLPRTLRRIGVVVVAESKDDDRIRELEALVADLVGEIQELNGQLESLRARPIDDVFLKSFKEQAGKSLGDWKMWAAVLGGVAYLTGYVGIEETLKGLATSVKELFGAGDPTPPLPPFTV